MVASNISNTCNLKVDQTKKKRGSASNIWKSGKKINNNPPYLAAFQTWARQKSDLLLQARSTLASACWALSSSAGRKCINPLGSKGRGPARWCWTLRPLQHVWGNWAGEAGRAGENIMPPGAALPRSWRCSPASREQTSRRSWWWHFVCK